MQTQRDYMHECGCGSLHFESAGEYTLPDYNTDVKRVLLSRADVVGESSFVNGDSLSISGSVLYTVVYVDPDNEVTSCEFTTEFESSYKCNGEQTVGSLVHTAVTDYSLRLTGPRRFSAKAQLSSNVALTETATLTVEGSAFDGREPEVKTANAAIASRAYSDVKTVEYNEEIAKLDGVIADDISILYCDCLPDVTGSVNDSGVDVSGKLTVRILYKRDGELPELMTKEIPISETLALLEADPSSDPELTVRMVSRKCATEPTEDGVAIKCELKLEYSASCVTNKHLPVILDCYLTDTEVSNEHSEFPYTEYIGCAKSDPVFDFSLSRDEMDCAYIRDILVPCVSIRCDACEIDGDNLKICGKIRFSGVACEINEAGELGFVGLKQELPFETNVKYSCHLPASAQINAVVSPTSVIATVGDDGIALTVGASITASASATRKLTRLSISNAVGEGYPERGSVITVYYPDGEETLFDVGRRFHVRTVDVAADNSLTEEVFSSESSGLKALGVKSLIIR